MQKTTITTCHQTFHEKLSKRLERQRGEMGKALLGRQEKGSVLGAAKPMLCAAGPVTQLLWALVCLPLK